MRAWWTVALVALSLSGCLQGGDEAGDREGLDGLGAASEHPYRVAFSHGGEELVAGPWEHTVTVTVGSGWRDLAGALVTGGDDPYAGRYDLELIAPDGTVRDTCGPTGCGQLTGGTARVTHGGGAGDVQHGAWTLRAWGEGVGTVRFGVDAMVPEGSLVPVAYVWSGPVAAQWRQELALTLPAGSAGLHGEVGFTAYDGLWAGRFTAPSGNTFGSCKDGCGPTVVNNAGDQHTVEAPAPGTWSVEAEGDGAGLLRLTLSAFVPAS